MHLHKLQWTRKSIGSFWTIIMTVHWLDMNLNVTLKPQNSDNVKNREKNGKKSLQEYTKQSIK